MAKSLQTLSAFTPDGELRVVIETPKGSRNKYAFDEEIEAFVLTGVLPEGTTFPYDFGMIPSTKGKDGDPLDILVLLDAAAFPGCVISARIIGAIEADQKEEGEWSGNDRLIGVATNARTHDHITSLADLRPAFVEEIEGFFEHYNRLSGREFRPMSRLDAAAAIDLVHKAQAAL